jgi:hypothetical protein
MKIDQHPFPTNTVEVSSKDTARVKLLTSESAQKKGDVDPKVQTTTVDVTGKGLLLEEEDIKPRRLVTPQMLINKFQRQQEEGEKSGHNAMKDIGDVRSSSIVGRKESNYRQWKIVQSATRLITIAAHPRGFASMTEGLRLWITMNSTTNGSQFING